MSQAFIDQGSLVPATKALAKPDVLRNYIRCFRSRLTTANAFINLMRRCERQSEYQLLSLTEDIYCDVEDDAMRQVFLDFVTGDGEPSATVALLHTKWLAAFDEFAIPLAAKLKDAGRKMVESEFALWQAHRQLLSEVIKNPAYLVKVDRSRRLRRLADDTPGFILREQLCSAEIWRQLFPQATIVIDR